MKYAIFSDVHSNLEALSAVLGYFKKKKANSYICCGDITGYGPNPNECIQEVSSLPGLSIVTGNHDAASCGIKDIEWFNEYARAAILWTENQLTGNNRKYISRLPEKFTVRNMTVVHGSPRSPIDEYLLAVTQTRENMEYFDTQICLVGHSHIPFVFSKNKEDDNFRIITDDKTIKIDPDTKYIINVGSVGQPRDENPLACCVFYDTDIEEIKFYRLEYDIKTTQEKMVSHHLPSYLIERLTYGT
jgi:predicted phosphodiesterase